jgi:hypothetical protein
VRDLGGLALDLGSALDRLAGKITRGPRRGVLQMHAQGMSVPEIAARLEERFGQSIDQDKIRKLTSEASPRSTENPHELDWARAKG